MEKIIEIEKVTKKYGHKNVLQGIDLTIYKGDIYGLLGLNGSGKSTLMKIFLGLIGKDSGQIKVNGKMIENLETPPKVGALIEYPAFYEYLSAVKNLTIFADLYGVSRKRVQQVLEIVGLDTNDEKKVKKYSMGMKQRLSIARAFLNDPDIIILDEPTNGLDPSGVIEIENLITMLAKQEQKTFIITSHIMGQIEKMCNRVGILSNGIIMTEGNVKTLLATDTEQYILVFDRMIDEKKAIDILKSVAEIVKIENCTMTISTKKSSIGKATSLFAANGWIIKDIQKKTRDLENYFMERLNVNEK